MTTIGQTIPAQTATTNKQRPRRMARPASATDACAGSLRPSRSPSKLDQIEALLLRPEGASIPEMMATAGWQAHSVRGAMAGALKQRGLTIASDKAEGARRYRASRDA